MIVVVISNTNSNSSYKLNSNSSCNIVVVILERTRGIQVASSPPAEGKSLICKPHASLANEAVIALVAAAAMLVVFDICICRDGGDEKARCSTQGKMWRTGRRPNKYHPAFAKALGFISLFI